MTTRGVCWVVYGEKAEQAVLRAQEALAYQCPALPTFIMRTSAVDGPLNAALMAGFTPVQRSRFAKLTLLFWSPFEQTAYLDADTLVYQDITAGFDLLSDGWDMAMAPSQNQDEDNLLWHIGEDDKRLTLDTLTYDPLQLQAGVMFVARNDRTAALFAAWREEWARFRNQDQGALLRALQRAPVKVWLLGRCWNGGAVIGHRFGELRA